MTESYNGWTETHSGVKFFPFEPRAEGVRIADVAHHLSNQCRYAGATRWHYSVAQHSVLLCDWVMENYQEDIQDWADDTGDDPALLALMHDCAEAYCNDVVRPIKYEVQAFLDLEETLERVIFPVFGLEWPLPDWLRELDSRIIRDEREQVLRPSGHRWFTDDLEPLGVGIRRWSQRRAKWEFLRRFNELHTGMSPWRARLAAGRQCIDR